MGKGSQSESHGYSRRSKALEDIIESEGLDESIKEEARTLYDQLEHSKPYYDWLLRLAKSVQSGEIFEFIPIDNKK